MKVFYRKNEFTYCLCYLFRKSYYFLFFYIIPDKVAIEWKFYRCQGYKLDWHNLKTYSEKIQWLKLNDRKSWYSNCVDKFKVREFITRKLGTDKYLIPLYFESTHWQDVKSENMPNIPFVIKCNHDNASYTIVKDKNSVDWKQLRLYYKRRLKGRSFFWCNREWPYKNVKPRVIVEKLLVSSGEEYKLQEFKFHCFHGEVKVIAFYEIGMDGVERYRHLNADYTLLNENCSFGSYNEVKKEFNKPLVADEMKEIALKIAKDFEFYIRVDIYQVDGHLFVGELTFFDGAGYDIIRPHSWNVELGSYLHLPIDKN